MAFPHVFYRPLNTFHRAILDPLDARDEDGTPVHPRIVVAAPRGLGKTNLLTLGKGGQSIVHGLYRYILYITAAGDVAIRKTETLKRELLWSRPIVERFGRINEKPIEGIDLPFAKDGYIAYMPRGQGPDYRGTMVMPRGGDQQIRSLGEGEARPDLVLGDDIDNPRVITNEKVRQELKEWWFGDVLPCVSRYDPRHQIVYIGTMSGDDCLLSLLLAQPDWHKVNLSVCDENYQTLCPEYMSQVELDETVERYKTAGMLHVFRREYMNQASAQDSQPFRPEYFQRYSETSTEFQKLTLHNIVLVDPARADGQGNALSAIVGVGISRETNAFYVRDVVAAHMPSDELYAKAIQMAVSLGARAIGCEITGLSEFIRGPFRNAIAASGHRIEFLELHARTGQGEFAGRGGGKVGRISGLIPFYRKGQVFHNPRVCGIIEQQLLDFRLIPDRNRRCDAIDALAYIVEYQDKREMFFHGAWKPEKERQASFERALETRRRASGFTVTRNWYARAN